MCKYHRKEFFAMKLKYIFLTLAAAAAVFLSAAYAFPVNAENFEELSSEKIGYGQGRNCDDENIPYGAADFNSCYGKYNACALNKDSDCITLTFDQGYENGYTSSILDTLKEKNVKAVFFLTGDYAKKETELVKRMINEGHVIGNHGMKHLSLPTLSYDDSVNEISSLHNYVKENYGYDMKLFRPPCGEYSERALAIAQSLGYKTCLWSFAYCDWDVNNQPDTAEALDRVTGAGHKGAIYLLHSVSKTNCEILPQVIDTLRSKGYEFADPNAMSS